jgi:kynurenine formamidase
MNELAQFTSLIRSARIVDLSPVLENGMPLWPTHPPLVINGTVTHARDGYFCQTIFMAEHTGAHVDAPAHMFASMMDQTIDTFEVGRLMAPASIFDLRPLALLPGDIVDVATLERVDAEHEEPLGPGDIALLNFGWQSRYKVGPGWRDYAENSPGLSEEAVLWIKSRSPRAVGSDTLAVDWPMRDGHYVTPSFGHDKHWLPNGILMIEALANLDELPERCFFAALPLKIKGGSGSPLRPIAIVFEGK